MGYTFLYDQMVAARAVFGAETSGHVYFKVSDTYYTESAAYALAVILRLLAARGAARSPSWSSPCATATRSRPRSTSRSPTRRRPWRRSRSGSPAGQIDRMDGVSMTFDDFWFNVRASNTEPLLRLRLEARNADDRARRNQTRSGGSSGA